MNPKTIISIFLATIVGIGLLFGVYLLVSSSGQAAAPIDLKVSSKDWIKGNPKTKKVVVEYGDFQCPACKAYQPLVGQVLAKYKNSITFVFRHFPLAQHKNAVVASMAAEAAGVQGKFWEMHDILYQNQDEWASSNKPNSFFLTYAQKLQLNLDQFKKDLDNDVLRKKIQLQIDFGNGIPITSTPTFYVNGVQLQSPQSLKDFDAVLQ